jgi:CrcB protein
MQRFFFICLAGALGTGTRYLIGLAMERLFGKVLPFGTLLVNVLGCFLIALVMELALRPSALAPTTRLALVTGFMGGLTTYSSFNYDCSRFFLEGQAGKGLAYLGLTLGLCFGAGVVGLLAGRALATS